MIGIDTNVIVYMVDERDPLKQVTAAGVLAVLNTRCAALPLQIAGEFANAATRRLHLSTDVVADVIKMLFQSYRVEAHTQADVIAALDLASRRKLAFWDALLITTSLRLGVTTLLSEDMSDLGNYDGVRVINPFAAGGGLSSAARAVLES